MPDPYANPIKALLTGRMTPKVRSAIREQLGWVLGSGPPSPDKQTHQVPPFWGLTPMRENPTTDLALKMMNEQYPEGAALSPTATTVPLYPWLRARRWPDSGLIQVNRGIVPTDTDAPPDWSRKFLELLDTTRHELSHGRGLPDTYSHESWRGLSAQDVDAASARLHEDIELPPSGGSR